MLQNEFELSPEIKWGIEELYANSQRKLQQICNKEISGFGGISQKDYDDFYSRAGYELNTAIKTYDPSKGKSFLEYAYGVIKFAIWKEMTDRNRAKRQHIIEREERDQNGNISKIKEYISNISIDAPLGDENDLTVGDILQSDYNMEDAITENESTVEYSAEMKDYLNRLSKLQVKVLELMADEYTPEEIRKSLHIDSALYNDSIAAIRSYKNTKCIISLIRRRNTYVR